MATTIKSTALDFQNIKNNLKGYLEASPEFADYDFEASGLSTILDVLAYNTHVNGLTANFALNESFLGTAQLRSSIVSLAEGLGYIPDSMNGSEATVKMSFNLSGTEFTPAKLQVATGYTFTTSVDEQTFIFQTTELVEAIDDGNGFFAFKTLDGSTSIPVKEGTSRRKTFIAGEDTEGTIYIIPDPNMDIDTAVVRVYESAVSSDFYTYQPLKNATSITENTPAYILKEAPNGFYEMSFGNGITLGKTPAAGTKITVDYLSVQGAVANNAKIYEAVNRIEVTEPPSGNGELRFPTVSTVTGSAGGSGVESIESIRKNAPFQYASQNRMVTHADYSALVLRRYSNIIKDIKAWGGEDNLDPEFGTVFLSILYGDNLDPLNQEDASIITQNKVNVTSLVNDLSIASFDLKFSDPIKTFLETQVFFQYNPDYSTISLNAIQEQVKDITREYFRSNTGSFGQSFRRSNLLTEIDAISTAILSSRAVVKMQQRIVPSTGQEANFNLSFPVPIAVQDDVNYIVSSSTFIKNNVNCFIQNKLGSTKLQVVSQSDNSIIVDNVGSFTPSTGKINIVGLLIDGYVGTSELIKITCLPSNQSAITPEREYIISFDNARTSAQGILVTATN